MLNLTIQLRQPHPKQEQFILSTAKRKVIKAGRRAGKTVGAAELSIKGFLLGKRVLYATPTEDQISSFWFEIKQALQEPIDAGIYIKNETMHYVELAGTKQRIRAKTAYNADTLRGDFADILILDEFQLMAEDTWDVVGAPMLADNDGDAVFIYTPPGLHSSGRSKATDPLHAMKMFKKAQQDTTGRWEAFKFTSYDNPYISKTALDELVMDMTSQSYQMEIMAEEFEDAPGALWKRSNLDSNRVRYLPETLRRIVIGVDPSGSTTGDECGIIAAGRTSKDYFVLKDVSLQASPQLWAEAVVKVYRELEANLIIAEANYGGEMVRSVLRQAAPGLPIRLVHASRGKEIRAEPVAALYEQNRVHHLGLLPKLENEMCYWTPGDKSPNRMDALVWALVELSNVGVIKSIG